MVDKIFKYIKDEEERIKKTFNLIASENLPSPNILKALGSIINFKYSEGNVGRRNRYYNGNRNIDKIEEECIKRAKKLFKCKFANVQPISGSIMNIALITYLLKPGDTILSLDLKSGAHLTHGSSVNLIGKLYKIINYNLDSCGFIDYEDLKEKALKYKPKLIISGTTSYPRKINFKKIGEIAKKINAYHLVDISHLAGLVVSGFHQSPILYADFVTTTTHKTLRSVRGGLILSNKLKYKNIINKIIFPHFQGGPHPNIIAANAIALKEAGTRNFKLYIKKVLENTKYLCEKCKKNGFKIVSGGTDTHQFLIDLNKENINGREFADALEKENIIVNANVIPNDKGTQYYPKGIRLGCALVTTQNISKRKLNEIANKIKEVFVELKNKKM